MFKKKLIEEKPEERFILCLDGGGMRGIVPAVLLGNLVKLVREYDDTKPLYAHFDLIAGTSTGALLALGLSTPPQYLNIKKEEGTDEIITFPLVEQTFMEKLKKIEKLKQKQPIVITRGCEASHLLDLYKNSGAKIFPPQTRLFGQLIRDKYRAKPLEDFLKSFYSEAKLSQCMVPTMAVSYEIQEGIPYIFKSWDSKDFYTREVARATSAAPTYFPPVILHERSTDKKLTLVDGAMVANNPVVFAYGEAKTLYPNCKKFHIISLSTASSTFSLGDEEFSGGLMAWIDPSKGAPIQKIYASSQMQIADYMAKHNEDIEYTRVDYHVAEEKFKLDDTSSHAIAKLEEIGQIVYEKNEEKIIDYVEKLIKKNDFSHVQPPEIIQKEGEKEIKQYEEESFIIPEVSIDFKEIIEHTIIKENNTKNISNTIGFFKKIINSRIEKEPIKNSHLISEKSSALKNMENTELAPFVDKIERE
ncbi:MAG: patatin-like phospholipase family protein [Spirochaetaceae bacterium]|nr:patatin-like phospholipase family protein [Spirochaetaceae bacterium]